MRLYHALTNRPPWGPSDHLTRIDSALLESGSIPLTDLDVGTFALEEDGNHYTREDFPRFTAQLAHAVHHMEYPLIVSDSTVDWHNYNSEWEWTGWASDVLRRALSDRCVVDVVCGSGFVARAAQNEHFYTRVSQHIRSNKGITDVVILGGWNDEGRTEEACRVVPRLASLVQRY
tara:strand:+ start:731 stop:1255 length:525 start_codon:yes stop_codon:yes gene_type:complete